MGVKLKDLIQEEEQESLVEDKSKKTMKFMVMGIGVLLFIILLVIVVIIKNTIVAGQLEEIKMISKDVANLSTKVSAIGVEYRSGISDAELVGLSLENEPKEIYINGKREEYRYGYYYLTAEEVNGLVPTLNKNDQEYIVNYTTGEVINVWGVDYNGRRYHSNIDITALASGQTPPSDVTVYINTPQDMELIRQNPNGYYKLSADIDMEMYANGDGWKPIAEFGGIFEGRGYKITNLKINRDSERYCGLFGQVTATAQLSEIVLENVEISGGEYTGALAGSCSGRIINCNVQGIVNGSGNFVGGLVGAQNTGSIINSYAKVAVTGDEKVGGFIGSLHGGVVNASYANGTVVGSEDVGGFIGEIKPTSLTEVNQTYADSRITAKENAGGLIGSISILNDQKVNVLNSYAVGAIEDANNTVGGLVGRLYATARGTISFDQLYTAVDTPIDASVRGGFAGEVDLSDNANINNNKCLWEKDSALNNLEQKDVGTASRTISFEAKTEAEMKIQATYNQWDWENVWNIDEDVTRAYLKWQPKSSVRK